MTVLSEMKSLAQRPPSRGGGVLGALIAALSLLAHATPAPAHTRSQSQSAWVVEGDTLSARIEADALDVTRLYALGGEAPLQQTFLSQATSAFAVSAGDQPCEPRQAPQVLMGSGARIALRLTFTCPPGALARGRVSIQSQLFLRVAPSHLHFVSLRDGEGRGAEAILSEAHPRASLVLAAEPESESFLGALARFFPIGAQHVWSGLDHLAFILALALLAGGRVRPLILAITGFTLGHTLTLGLAATGVLRPDQSAVEALIGFTIAFVALEIGGGGSDRMLAWSGPLSAILAAAGLASVLGLNGMPPLIWFGLAAFVYSYPRGFPRDAAWLAAAFGLIHGCGFAGALTALDLPQPRLLAALAGFNLGVEAGQIAVIAAAVLVGFLARRAPERLQTPALRTAGAVLFGLGAFWLCSRALLA